MRILFSGSRDFPDLDFVHGVVNDYSTSRTYEECIVGDARGVDEAVQEAAAGWLDVKVFKAEWEKHGRRAGILRNIQMLDEQPDLVVAFWDGESPGTKHVIDEAKKRGINLDLYIRYKRYA